MNGNDSFCQQQANTSMIKVFGSALENQNEKPFTEIIYE